MLGNVNFFGQIPGIPMQQSPLPAGFGAVCGRFTRPYGCSILRNWWHD